MTCITYTKKAAVFHTAYIAFLSVAGLAAVYSAVYGFLNISCTEDIIALCFTVFFALLILSVDFFECRAMGARLYMTDDGIGVKRFGKTKVFIKWNAVKEIGIGSIPTPFGSKERAYFSDKRLSEAEKTDLIVLKYHTVHFLYIPERWYRKMSERLPVVITGEVKERYVR